MATPLDHALLRLDHALLDRVSLQVIPLQLGARARRVLLALAVAAAGLATLVPPARAQLPARVVHLPGRGWVDAAELVGLPAGVPDGARLELREVGAACPEAALAAAPAPEPAAEGAAPTGGALAAGARVSLNQATLAELESLPGVGPALARRIVAARPYRQVAELDRVKGIGPKSIRRLAPLVQP